MPTAQIGKLTIGYDVRGPGDAKSAEPFLLLSGFGMTRHMWSNELCDLLVKEGFTVVRMDNRDTGESTRMNDLGVPAIPRLMAASFLGKQTEAPYRLEDMADDAAGLMAHLGFDKFHVAGASMGGMIAQTLAAIHPDRVLSLASIMSTPGGRRWSVGQPKALWAILQPVPTERAAQEQHLVDVFRTLSGGSTPFEEERLRTFARLHTETKPSMAGSARQFAAILESLHRRPKLVAGLRLPTVAIHGALDPMLPPRGARRLGALVPGAEVVIVPNMGHDFPTGALPAVVAAMARNARRATASATAIAS